MRLSGLGRDVAEGSSKAENRSEVGSGAGRSGPQTGIAAPEGAGGVAERAAGGTEP
jgi:hypothetical protein